MTTRKYDRAQIMRDTYRLMREEGLCRSAAQRKAWALAKGEIFLAPRQQPSGFRAAARRYGLDKAADRLTILAVPALAELAQRARMVIAAIGSSAPAALPYHGATIELRRGEDGGYRL